MHPSHANFAKCPATQSGQIPFAGKREIRNSHKGWIIPPQDQRFRYYITIRAIKHGKRRGCHICHQSDLRILCALGIGIILESSLQTCTKLHDSQIATSDHTYRSYGSGIFALRSHLTLQIYAIASFLALMFPEEALYFDFVRDCYESYVLYQFFTLLVNYFDGEESLIRTLRAKPKLGHPFPLCCLPVHILTTTSYSCRNSHSDTSFFASASSVFSNSQSSNLCSLPSPSP